MQQRLEVENKGSNALARCLLFIALCAAAPINSHAAEPEYPPKLPDGKSLASITSDDFLKPPAGFASDVAIATATPTVEFLYYPKQDYPAKTWSAWGDSLAVGDKYYSSIGDHEAPSGNAFVYEYDAASKTLKTLVDVKALLKLPADHYTPGKIHGRIDLGSDGWLYFATHRGSTRATTAENHFQGEWILRHHPESGKSETVAHAPLANQCYPTSTLDPERMIFYAGTADGNHEVKTMQFLAYDLRHRKVLYSDNHGPYRYLIFARSTGKVYFHGDPKDMSAGNPGAARRLVRFDPEKAGKPGPIDATIGLRAATDETSDGLVYTVDGDNLWAFDVKSERVTSLGPLCVGKQTYIASIDVDPKTGRYLYYVAGAHGGSHEDGAPLVQYDVKQKRRKVIAFLHPVLHQRLGYTPLGTYGTAVSPEGEKVFITWNGNRGAEPNDRRVPFNTCALTVVHIPASERPIE
jgi:hypothetical protein